ncbi:helix-turn-helix domain-containing protein [Lederbergia wuyishanensis]|uniref:helix-turn-helix domain-containing protein n=1 Tax=Lederbergia wuyishanensis TaxID=1347903 RepID=UPI003522F711
MPLSLFTNNSPNFANSVGTTRETINRLLNQLGKDNILKVDRNRIVFRDFEVLKQQLV